MIIQKYKPILEKELKSDKRLTHSIEVANLTKELLSLYNIKDHNDEIVIGALFHDVCKYYTEEQYINLIGEKKYKKLKESPLLHGYASSIYLEKNLNIKNKKVLNGVKFHTVGNKNFTIIEKIIFIADKVDATRTYPKVEIIRKALLDLKDINKAILMFLNEQELVLKRKEFKLAKESIVFRKSLIKKECLSATFWKNI